MSANGTAAPEGPKEFAFKPEYLERAKHIIAKYPAGKQASAVMPLLDLDGTRVKGNRRDSEGLALLPDGRWAVSFERWHRIEFYAANPAGGGRSSIDASL